MDLQIPFYGAAIWLFGVFVVAAVVLHLLFVVAFPLNKTQLKQFDFIWILIAVIGLCGSETTIRRAFAGEYVEIALTRLRSKYDFIRYQIKSFSSPEVCRRAERPETSEPNSDVLRKEFDNVCEFGRQALAKVPDQPPTAMKDFDAIGLRDRPAVSSVFLKSLFKDLDLSLETYANYLADYQRLRKLNEYSDLELIFAVISPNLLAVALALRLTKVTGELKLDKRARESESATTAHAADTTESRAASTERPRDAPRDQR
jgi:hypothetical protein